MLCECALLLPLIPETAAPVLIMVICVYLLGSPDQLPRWMSKFPSHYKAYEVYVKKKTLSRCDQNFPKMLLRYLHRISECAVLIILPFTRITCCKVKNIGISEVEQTRAHFHQRFFARQAYFQENPKNETNECRNI